MTRRGGMLLIFGFLLACESATGPEVENWSLQPLPQQSLVSSDAVKTVLMRDGTLYSRGDGRSGALGQGDKKSKVNPTKVPGLKRVISYAQDGGMAFALTEDGSLYQWGSYIFSRASFRKTTSPTRAGKITGAISAFAYRWQLYVVDDQGSLWSVEPSHSHPGKTNVPQQVPLAKRVVQVSGGVGLFEDGTLFGLQDWGTEDGGLVEGLDGVVALHHSYENSMVLKTDGTVWSWGHAPACTLGDGVHTESLVPIQVPGITDAIEVSAHWEALIQTADEGLYVFEPETLKVRKVFLP